jgi:mono/diheme cytochrome c family protein
MRTGEEGLEKMKNLCLVMTLSLFLTSLIIGCSALAITTTRWYTPEQVSMGTPLYASHCAGCHGVNGEGAPNSHTPLQNGSYPPQPLNGSGHSWHHSLSNLEETIEKGGRHSGATMPGFAELLNQRERTAVIAAFQSFWDDRTYEEWLERGGLD